jgi:hypothetical protein
LTGCRAKTVRIRRRGMVAKDAQREEVIIDECTELDLRVLRGPAV